LPVFFIGRNRKIYFCIAVTTAHKARRKQVNDHLWLALMTTLQAIPAADPAKEIP
jgi:hypothetical protein